MKRIGWFGISDSVDGRRVIVSYWLGELVCRSGSGGLRVRWGGAESTFQGNTGSLSGLCSCLPRSVTCVMSLSEANPFVRVLKDVPGCLPA